MICARAIHSPTATPSNEGPSSEKRGNEQGEEENDEDNEEGEDDDDVEQETEENDVEAEEKEVEVMLLLLLLLLFSMHVAESIHWLQSSCSLSIVW